jgi:hypothetical protein
MKSMLFSCGVRSGKLLAYTVMYGESVTSRQSKIANAEPLPPLPPRTKLRRYFFLLIVLGLSLYFLLPQLARIEHGLRVAFTLKIPFIALSLGAQIFSYLGSG